LRSLRATVFFVALRLLNPPDPLEAARHPRAETLGT
jgi:hypothetical protein